jgi:hypothetical protein
MAALPSLEGSVNGLRLRVARPKEVCARTLYYESVVIDPDGNRLELTV